MIVDTEQRALLAAVGFFLFRSGKVEQAERIFTGLAASAPERDGPYVGLALCAIVNGNADAAADMLSNRLQRGDSPIADALMLYKLVALGMGGHMEKANACRDEMRGIGMEKSLEKADTLLLELKRLQAETPS